MWRRLYDWTLNKSSHPHAVYWLALIALAEASFFPIPPEVLLAPMVMAQRDHVLRLATITTVFSVIGGVLGFAIGYFFIDIVTPWLHELHYWDRYLQVQDWYAEWGFWATFVAGFTPVPYKIFTIAAGAAHMNLPMFILASLLSRGARYLLVAYLVRWAGPALEDRLIKYIDLIGWLMVGLIAIAIVIYS